MIWRTRLGETFRNFSDRLKGRGRDDVDDLIGRSERSEYAATHRGERSKWLIAAPGFIALIALYYVVGAALFHHIDDNLAFTPAKPIQGGSKSVDVAAALIEREVIDGHWVANDPFFIPSAALDNMPNYQQGIVYALSRFAFQLSDQLGRSRGSSQVDPDLDRAAGLLKYPGTVWLYDPSISLLPTASSESQYRAGRKALLSYNERLATGKAIFERRTDNLIAVLDAIAADIGSQSAIMAKHVGGGVFDTEADDIFYTAKGRLYAYALLLHALQDDFRDIIGQRDIATLWQNMQESVNAGAALDPRVVVNARADSVLFASHLAALGFYTQRTQSQLREITNVLSK